MQTRGVKALKNEKEDKIIAFKKEQWNHCSIHDIDYPASATCPKCDRTRKR
jgi:hypothetical protein